MIDFTLHYHRHNDEQRNDHRAENGVDPYHYLGDTHLRHMYYTCTLQGFANWLPTSRMNEDNVLVGASVPALFSLLSMTELNSTAQ
mmetsp:Transcript_14128/g.23540  ORF Transcript_14128/g.23540 Transcript_14128/m.23540 type:complete len:86 (-) Transcript_14128:112-369(-)